MDGCTTAHYPVNERLGRIDPAAGHRFHRAAAADPDDHLFLHVSISGGGSADVPHPVRAARALADLPINRNSASAPAAQRTLLAQWREEVRPAHADGDFELSAADVALLRRHAADAMRRAPDFQALLRELDVSCTAPPCQLEAGVAVPGSAP